MKLWKINRSSQMKYHKRLKKLKINMKLNNNNIFKKQNNKTCKYIHNLNC